MGTVGGGREGQKTFKTCASQFAGTEIQTENQSRGEASYSLGQAEFVLQLLLTYLADIFPGLRLVLLAVVVLRTRRGTPVCLYDTVHDGVLVSPGNHSA